jgi:hypothetical protein
MDLAWTSGLQNVFAHYDQDGPLLTLEIQETKALIPSGHGLTWMLSLTVSPKRRHPRQEARKQAFIYLTIDSIFTPENTWE